MKKIFLSLIAVAVGTLSSFAQDDLVATLSHGSALSTFTGADALSQAYAAAEEGDVITLSPGVFTAVNIEKAITVRGAGMLPMESNGYVSTQIAGGITLNVPSDAASVLTIEGLHFLSAVGVIGDNLAPTKFLKSRFESDVYGHGISMSAYSCIFSSSLRALYSSSGSSSYKNTTLNFLNCVIINAQSSGVYNSYVAKINATNCIVKPYSFNGSGDGSISNSNFVNCIIASYSNGRRNYPLPQTCTAQNCVGVNSDGGTSNLFSNILNPSNVMIENSGESAYSSIFKTATVLDVNPAFTEAFELTETAAATYLGDDGTQVGIYGGPNPFDPTPTNPQVNKFTVNSTTEGDQLKVRINVE